MKKIVFLISVFFSTLLFADCIVYENKAYAETGYTAYEKECKAYGGGGSVFQGSINASSSTNTCNGGYADGAYVLRVSCNTCGSEIVQKDIQENKEFCKERCKSTQMYCSHTLNSWGSNLVGSVESCGLEDHTLPGCSESSSSAKSSSSSSVYNSSSSEQEYFSSSEDTNPASSNDVSCEYDCEESSSSEASSGSEDSSSSSSEESSSSGESSSSEESVSSSSESNLVACYTPDKNGGCKLSRSVSKVRPPMRGEPSLAENNMVFCEYENSQIYVGFFANIAAVKFVEDPTDYFSLCYYDESNCGNLTDPSAYPIPILKESFYECSMTTLHEDGCEPVMGIGIYVDRNLQISDWSESWIPSNVTRDQIISLGDEIVRTERSMVVYYNDKKIGHGLFSNLSPRTLAGAVDFCDYIIKEYEWDHRSSSSKQSESSSSSEASSSSVAEESSSSEIQSSSREQQYSSSSEKLADSSSSVFEEISSSSIGAETFVADGSQTYTSDQIFRDGLQNMEPGKCYSLNPEREPVTGWNLSYNAQDSWWWHEVDCETGEKPIENGIGVCAAYPGSKPSNTSTCYAYNGSCYRCDNDRDYVDCKADWLWNYNFPYHDWFKQVDCDDPYEEEDDDEGEFFAEGCLDESLLKKASIQKYSINETGGNKSYLIDFIGVSQKFDVLGRRNMYRSSKRQVLFDKNVRYDKKELNEDRFVISGTLSGSSAELCDRLPSGEWVCGKKRVLARRLNDASEFKDPNKCNIQLGVHYGILENGYLVGGMTCAWPNKNVDESKSGYITRISDITETTEFVNGKKRNVQIYKYKVEYKIVSNTVLGDNDHLIVETGYVFPNGHVTTRDEERAFDKHENGHEKYNSCVIFDEIEESSEFECAIKLSKSMRDSEKNQKANEKIQKELEKIRDDLIEKQLKKDQVKLNNAAVKFHKDYGIGGWSDSYECPKY